MVELIRTNDAVLLSWLTAALADAGVESVILDVHTSVLEGSISAIPRRVMVAAGDLVRAQRVLAEADRLAGRVPADGARP